MASSRKRRPAERAAWDLAPRVRAALADAVPAGSRILVGLSGGVDSVVLLDLLRRLGARRRWRLSALHVNHQLQPAAADWARFCRGICREAAVPLRVTRVSVAAGNSLEGAARRARYEALLAQPADFIALAHNRDDQAETVLLHLLRGAGVRGLAGMRPASEPPYAGRSRGATRAPCLLRPLLDVPRADIEQYAAHRRLAWIEDPTNASPDYARNFLRIEVLPVVAGRFPAYREALARAARHAGEAAELLDALARSDWAAAASGAGLSVTAVRSLSPARAKNLLACFLREHGIEVPSADRLEEALRQVTRARRDAAVSVEVGAAELRVHRGVVLLSPRAGPVRGVERVWGGEPALELPELGCVLHMTRRTGAGLSVARLQAAPVTVRSRRGGERLRPHPNGPSRTVKNLLQEMRMPPWQRARVPFIYCGEELVCVPGVAMHGGYRAGPGEPGIVPVCQSC